MKVQIYVAGFAIRTIVFGGVGMRIVLWLLALVAGAVFALSSVAADQNAADDKRPLTFGVASIISAEESYAAYIDLAEYVSRRIGREVEFIQRQSYAEMNRLVSQGAVDVAGICTGAFIHMEQGRVRVLGAPVVRGSALYHSLLIVHEQSAATKVEDLRGRTFAFTDRLSNSGTLYPRYYMLRKGLQPDRFFSRLYYTNSHDRSIYLVQNNVVDAAAVDSLVYTFLQEESPERVDKIRVLHRSPAFVSPPFVASAELPEAEFRRLQEVFLRMHEDERGSALLRQLKIDRFERVALDSFEPLRHMQDSVNALAD